jgi:acetoacetate decarboxylase
LAPVAELPVLEVVSAVHILADLTLGLGKVVYDYLPARDARANGRHRYPLGDRREAERVREAAS